MTRAVVFDVDDTLYLERDYVRSGFVYASRHVEDRYGVGGLFNVAWRLFEQGSRGRIFNDALEVLGVSDGAVPVQELVGVYRQHRPSIELLPDSRALIDRLQAKGVSMAVITDGPSESQHAKVEALGLRAVASPVIVTADLEPGEGKPSETAFRVVERHLGFQGADLTYVADNPSKDFVAPSRLGWRTLRVRRETSLHEHVSSGPDVEHECRDLQLWELE